MKPIYRLSIFTAITLLLCSFTLKVTPKDKPTRFDYLVREDFFAGFNGDTVRFAHAMKVCEDTLRVHPNHPEALVWHGSGVSFLSAMAYARGDWQRGGELWEKGNQEMDSAVALAPSSVAVIIPRAATLFAAGKNTPPQYARPIIEKALADYKHILDMEATYFHTLSPHARGEVLGALAEASLKLNDTTAAKNYFTRIQNELPKTAYASQANRWLSGKQIDGITCLGCHTEN